MYTLAILSSHWQCSIKPLVAFPLLSPRWTHRHPLPSLKCVCSPYPIPFGLRKTHPLLRAECKPQRAHFHTHSILSQFQVCSISCLIWHSFALAWLILAWSQVFEDLPHRLPFCPNSSHDLQRIVISQEQHALTSVTLSPTTPVTVAASHLKPFNYGHSLVLATAGKTICLRLHFQHASFSVHCLTSQFTSITHANDSFLPLTHASDHVLLFIIPFLPPCARFLT